MTRRKLQPPPQQQPAAWPPGFVSKIDWRPSISRNPRTDIAVQERRAIEGVEQSYIRILDIKPVPPPRWTVDSAAHVGAMWATFTDEIGRALPVTT